MARLYGHPVSDESLNELLRRLRLRSTEAATLAVGSFSGGASRNATVETAAEIRDAILLELHEWDELDSEAPELVRVRDRLDAPKGNARAMGGRR
jgi:hypothetical protein